MKITIGTAYNNTKNALSSVDAGVRLCKHIYVASQPIAHQYAGHNISFCKKIM